MALTITRQNFSGASDRITFGDRWLKISSVAFDNSYVSNGEPLTFADLGFQDRPDAVFVVGGTKGYWFDYDYTNQKMLVYWGDNNNAADGPAVEVPNTTDISTLTAVIVMAIGKYSN